MKFSVYMDNFGWYTLGVYDDEDVLLYAFYYGPDPARGWGVSGDDVIKADIMRLVARGYDPGDFDNNLIYDRAYDYDSWDVDRARADVVAGFDGQLELCRFEDGAFCSLRNPGSSRFTDALVSWISQRYGVEAL